MLFKLHYLIGRNDKLMWQAETMISHFVRVIKMFNILVYCWFQFDVVSMCMFSQDTTKQGLTAQFIISN